jgi:hypothetical protein
MREPVHNRVAQEFLVRFLQRLAEYTDGRVHRCSRGIANRLSVSQVRESTLTYPSAYLIPSLFRHPDAQPFRFKPFGSESS